MRGKLVKIEKCSSTLLHWYRPFIGKIFRVESAAKNPFAKSVAGIVKTDCYAVISNDPKQDTLLILMSDAVDLKNIQGTNQNTRKQERGFRREK
jgi:hypothetical protein